MSQNTVARPLTLRDRILGRYARKGWRGFDRLLRAYGHVPGRTIIANTAAGTRMNLDPYSTIDRHVLRDGYYESEVLDAISAAMTPDGVLWDIGANIGLHAIAVKARHAAATVFAFEPSPAIVGLLWRNAALNRSDLRLFALALSDADGFATLHIANDGNPGMTTLSLYPGLEDAYQARTTVATIRGDALIERGLATQPTVIKIDVEGHEVPALQGMRGALVHPACRRVVFEDQAGQSPVKQLLTDLGFDIVQLSRNEDTAHNLHNFVADKRLA